MANKITAIVRATGAAKTLRDKLYDYEVVLDQTSTRLPMEVVETDEYFYVALEIPGLSSIKDVKFELGMLQFGYEVKITAEVRSAVEGDRVNEAISKRIIGPISWQATIKGVFEGRPECNYKYGIWKMRLRKRSQKEEAVDLVDF